MNKKIIILLIFLGLMLGNNVSAGILPSKITIEFSGAKESDLLGKIDSMAENKIKVCKEVSCVNFNTIDFNNSTIPFSIDTEGKVSGIVWGEELGWVDFSPPYGGVFVNQNGLVSGTAWSEHSGAINFSVTGQQVLIDPVSGKWSGWAWASGPFGGWIKFDCNANSCLKIVWEERKVETEENNIVQEQEPSSSFSFSSLGLKDRMIDLWDKTLGLFSGFKNININGSAFAVSYSNLKQILDNDYQAVQNLFGWMTEGKEKMFDVTGQAVFEIYDSIYSSLINYRLNLLQKIDKFLK